MIQVSQVSVPKVGPKTLESPAERSLFSLSEPHGPSSTTLSPERKVQLDD
ncbi:MAG: hypothetical protein RL187_767 [Actinomycetota bacterium]|jgi:hypothetical protein